MPKEEECPRLEEDQNPEPAKSVLQSESWTHSIVTGHVAVHALRWHLLFLSFGTGLLDAATYSDLGIFASNQTGNTIILLVEAISRGSGATLAAPLLAVGVSLASFLVFGIIAGQLALTRLAGSPRCKGWMAFSTWVQCLLLLIAAVLVQTDVLQTDRQHHGDGAIVIFLLAASSGTQVAMAKSCGVSEIPTAMLTSPYMDLLTDANLLTRSLRSADVTSRNIRLGYLVFFSSGTVLGAVAWTYSGTGAVLWTSFGLRCGNLAYILLAPVKCPPRPDVEGQMHSIDVKSSQ